MSFNMEKGLLHWPVDEGCAKFYDNIGILFTLKASVTRDYYIFVLRKERQNY